jgi:hypothetical protein
MQGSSVRVPSPLFPSFSSVSENAKNPQLFLAIEKFTIAAIVMLRVTVEKLAAH